MPALRHLHGETPLLLCLSMELLKNIARLGCAAAEVAAETLWPTRCALCDMPGSVLCTRCLSELPYIDLWRACQRCGSPFGYVQCDLCNPMGLKRLGLDELPFESCSGVVRFTGDTGQVVRVYKDQGEQRLASVMAQIMAQYVIPGQKFDAVTYVPATQAAISNRGFDHAELLASQLAGVLGLPLEPLFSRPKTRDQRGLDAGERIANLKKGLTLHSPPVQEGKYLLVDDVMTTGATLCAASRALHEAGVVEVACLTFARV